MSIATEISEFITETKFENIPSKTVEFTKELALKTMAGMIAGSKSNSTKKIVQIIKKAKQIPEASVIGCGFKSSLETSIFLNGYTAHAAELEDDQFPSATSDITVFPVIFPLAQNLKLTGKQFIEASALALEVMNRIGMYSLTPIGVTDLPFYGIIGAVVASAKALSLTKEEIKSAIGISIGRAGGFILNFGTDAHYLESALACRDGYLAAVFAREGMTGGVNFEEWLAKLLINRDFDLDEITNDLGRKWHVHNIWVKKYPCCFLTHRQIDMLQLIMKEENVRAQDVDLIEIEVGPVDATCNRPNPKDIEDSRFSFQHILAGLLLEGDVNYEIFTNEKIANEKYKEMRSKVKVIVREDWPNEFNSGIARLTVKLRNGRKHEMKMKQALGGPENPLSREEFIKLYKKYTKEILPDEKIEKTCKMILNMEELNNVGDVMNYVE